MAFGAQPPQVQTLNLKIKGLYTNSNELSEAPEGALSIADNIVVNKDSVAESRRGFTYLPYTLPNLTDRADKLGQFQNSLLIHYNNTATTNLNNSLAYYNNGSGVVTYTGAYAHPDPLLARMKFAEANKNLYFTTALGVYKIDTLTNTPVPAGMYKGLDATAVASVNASGFMNAGSQVAYRIVWGITDANTNLVIGTPSQRAIIINSSASQQQVSLQITIPSGITVNHFYDIYRSNQSATATTIPDDAMQLVYEGNPTSAQITAKSITVIDNTPDSLRGAALYTNETQQGILQSNDQPPYALDLALFQTCMFYANVQTKQQIFLTLLAAGGTSGVQIADTVTIAGTTYTAGAAENVGTLTYQLVTAGSPAQNINDTALSLIRVINQNATNTSVYAYYLSSANSLPGQMLIQSRTLGTAAFSVTASARGTSFKPTLPTSGVTVISTNTATPNGLMYSKAGIPEAVPALNILYVGSASKKILRIVPIRNSLFILKEDGVFRCTGVPGNFSVDTIDSTIILIAPESAVALNNQCYCLTTQGVVAISDNGGPVISRPIEDKLTQLQGASLTALQYYSFGCAYESERQYVLHTVSSSNDASATQAFVYNYITKAWVRSTRAQSHALVLTADNKLYVTNPASSGISQERKSFTYTDYSDEAQPVTISAINGLVLTMPDVTAVKVGDRIYQSIGTNSIVTAVDPSINTVTVSSVLTTWTIGAASVLKSIACLMEWLPNVAGNPGYYRHWRETTLILKQNVFSVASLNFYNEISSSIDSVVVVGSPSGGWGQFPWGQQGWGGVYRSKPFRTYVPLEKQRCDLLSIQFQCYSSWAQFQVEGLSCMMNTIGERMTK
jgi:hypothetical protein